jgi:hypothetical protein
MRHEVLTVRGLRLGLRKPTEAPLLFSEEGAAKKTATELLAHFPMLQIEIYDATAKSRTSIRKR